MDAAKVKAQQLPCNVNHIVLPQTESLLVWLKVYARTMNPARLFEDILLLDRCEPISYDRLREKQEQLMIRTICILCLMVLNSDAIIGGEKNPRLATLLMKKVKPFLEKGTGEEVLPFILRALSLDPDCFEAALAAGNIHEKCKRNSDAIRFYQQAREILETKEKLSEEENAEITTLREKLAKLAAAVEAFHKFRRKYVNGFLVKAEELDKQGKPYSALRATMMMLAVDPENNTGAALKTRLTARLGDILTRSAAGSVWDDLSGGKTLSLWHNYTGDWSPDGKGGLHIRQPGRFVLLHNGPPRRNFVLSAEVKTDWNGTAGLMARTRPDGEYYYFGIGFDQTFDVKGKAIKHRRIEMRADSGWRRVRRLGLMVDSPIVPLEPGNWYRLELTCIDGTIAGSINGRRTFAEKIKQGIEGGIGLMGGCSEGAGFRKVRIMLLP